MSFTNQVETDVLKLIFQAVTWLSWAEDKVTSPYTNIYVSLHTADPGETGDQTTSEAAYTNYARVAVARTASGWAVSGNTADNVAAVTFATAGSGPESETHFGLGTDASGAGNLLGSGALTATLVVNNGVTPEFAIGDCNVTQD